MKFPRKHGGYVEITDPIDQLAYVLCEPGWRAISARMGPASSNTNCGRQLSECLSSLKLSHDATAKIRSKKTVERLA